MSVKLEIEGLMMNVVSDMPHKLAVKWKKAKFLSKLDEVVILKEERVVEEDINGHVGERNRVMRQEAGLVSKNETWKDKL